MSFHFTKKLAALSITLGLVLVASAALLIDFSKTMLTADGKTYVQYALKKGTVQDLLDAFQVRASSSDIVTPSPQEQLRWGERVQVVRVTRGFDERVEEVDFVLEWKRRTQRNLRMVEIQQGHRERKFWTVEHVFHDGREFEAHQTVKKVEKIPVERLAFLDEAGFPRKIYDLSSARKISVIATAYWVGDPKVPGVITFTGHHVERGLVAVDPRIIPLKHRLYIPGYGYAYSADTGSAIKGKRIDLFVENKKVSRHWEYKRVTVYILEKAEDW